LPEIITPFFVFRELNRTRQILEILFKYEFGDFLDRIRIWEHSNIEQRLLRRNPPEIVTLTFAERVRMAITELGPTFIKLGQMLSTRPDVVSPELIVELEKLVDRVGFLPADTVREVIEAEFGKPVLEIFDTFEDKPLAAASIAQVHRATLNGENLAIKIQRPNIQNVIKADLEIMRAIAILMEKYLPGSYLLDPKGLVEEFADDIVKELDFRKEASNLKHYTDNFSNYVWIKIPKIYDHLCTGKIITMDYLDGVSITDVERLKREGYDTEQIAIHGVEISLKSVLEFGFFHADPHAGNMLVLPGNVIGLLDYGMMGTFSTRTRYRLIEMFTFIRTHNEKSLARVLGELFDVEGMDPHDFEEGVAMLLEENTISSGEVQLGSLIIGLIKLAGTHKIPFPKHLLWIAKTIAAIDSLSRKLGANFNLLDAAQPFADRFLNKRASAFKTIRNSYFWKDRALEMVEDLPYELNDILHRFATGKVRFEFRPVGMEEGRYLTVRMINRIVLAFLTGTIFLGSAVLALSGLPPFIGAVPFLGAIGMILSLVLGLALIFSILLGKK
jgi:ubiquinone biosynthesis protein